ncbi:MAG: hypothetical protein VR64_02555 [Desulfatitalea sp. BRH_c12]|nr:MAG: hypothetical protein VR64_02555 [Desulfatitalea sp. BRH_c12]
MKKTSHNMGLRLFLTIFILIFTPWSVHCTASSLKPTISVPENKSKVVAVEEKSKPRPDDPGCVRGEPEQVLKSSKFMRLSRFTATEEYLLNENVALTIQHFGCAHFSESYHFKVKSITNSKRDWRSWMNFAADRLRELPVQDVVTMQIQAMTAALRDRAKEAPSYEYKTEIPVSEGVFVSFDVKPAGNFTEIIVQYQFDL